MLFLLMFKLSDNKFIGSPRKNCGCNVFNRKTIGFK